MKLPKYEYSISDDYLEFIFESVGPRGKFKKIILFSPANANGVTYFNLSFGDLNATTGAIDDQVVTNNQDREIILATVATSVLEFIQHFPDMTVYATGSTPARTRLYQMGISSHLDFIEPPLYVFGYKEGKGWESFRKNVNYDAFLIKYK